MLLFLAQRDIVYFKLVCSNDEMLTQ